MRYGSKPEVLDDIRTACRALRGILAEIPESRYDEAGVWGDGWTIVDLVAHLAEWQRMFIGWYSEGRAGREPSMPAPGYKWNETPRLNRDIREKHRSRPWEEVREDFDSGYRRILELVEELAPEALLSPGHFPWTGPHALTTYLGPNTASHYRFAVKVLRRWWRGTVRPSTGE